MPSHKNHYLSLTYFFNELAINKKHESSRRCLQLYLNFKEIPCKTIQHKKHNQEIDNERSYSRGYGR
ncbi:hypothetical protein AC784_00210 [Helicobacter pylori]|nr:hypothetical protein AC784_00210 [Helicobacter pylori]